MRQIDNMTPSERECLALKGMLASPHKPSTHLHPTLKACKCGQIGTRIQFYDHLDYMDKQYSSAREFFADHGEVPLNIDDPRIALTEREADIHNNGG